MIALQPAVLDAIAAEWEQAASPIVFRTAAGSELDDVYRLRFRAVIEEGWADPQDFPDGLERDAYDEEAIHIVGVEDSIVVATARLVLPVAGRPQPTEEAFELEFPGRERVIDLGRMVVAPGYRARGHPIFAGLLARSWLEARARGFSGFMGIVSASMVERYRDLGFEPPIVGQARRYWNEDRFAVFFDPSGDE